VAADAWNRVLLLRFAKLNSLLAISELEGSMKKPSAGLFIAAAALLLLVWTSANSHAQPPQQGRTIPAKLPCRPTRTFKS